LERPRSSPTSSNAEHRSNARSGFSICPNATELERIDPTDCRFSSTDLAADELSSLTVCKSLEVVPLVRVGRPTVVEVEEIGSALADVRDVLFVVGFAIDVSV
jgi:hypothetical protein